MLRAAGGTSITRSRCCGHCGGLCFTPETRDTMALNAENVAKALYRESADKIRRMYEAATANGFTSFAEA